ncbi:hypothetical protein [Deinococcus kurensis]|uniref:hypothetical protein n=1 Tax=Deinococcus kurensis TaxID=2662757 RepID=UPI0012D2D4A4|nr:hypothetical protein [Deinococcus kurensis]
MTRQVLDLGDRVTSESDQRATPTEGTVVKVTSSGYTVNWDARPDLDLSDLIQTHSAAELRRIGAELQFGDFVRLNWLGRDVDGLLVRISPHDCKVYALRNGKHVFRQADQLTRVRKAEVLA